MANQQKKNKLLKMTRAVCQEAIDLCIPNEVFEEVQRELALFIESPAETQKVSSEDLKMVRDSGQENDD